MARPEVAGSGTGRHGCGWDDNDGRRGEPPCDGPPPWRWSSFSIAASWTRLAAPWTRLANAWSFCRQPSRCTSVAWFPDCECIFVVSHSDGNLYVYDKSRDGNMECTFPAIKDPA
ncbi:hypothetical protein ZWY2020_037815 [Hordeum vulgare]|nr:hypothetical protein ZWY2020_040837 [Hordeum vulgare]KAI4995767.1 hypothetical protein ZWY2020_037815 [Hordeum vulgare]